MSESPRLGIPSVEAELLAATLDAAVEAIVVIEQGGTIVRVNPATERLFGYTSQELVGAPVHQLMPEPYRSQHGSYVERYLSSGEPHIIGIGREVAGRRKDGSVFPLDLSVGECLGGKRRLFVGLMRDLTERKRLTEALELREQELSSILDNSLVGTAVLDTSGRFLEVNRACREASGYNEAEILAKDLPELAPAEEQEEIRRVFERMRRGEITHARLEHRFVTKDGPVRSFSVHAALLRGAAGQQRIVAQLVDITDQVEAQRDAQENRERLAHLNRLSMLGELAAGIAHELNQPLGAISNYAQAAKRTLERGAEDPEKHVELLEKIAAQALRAGQVISRLRAHARQRHSERLLLDLNRTLREITRLGELETRHTGTRIELRLVPDLPMVLADEIEVQQVALNLIRNGVESMAETGGVLVVATTVDDGEAVVAVTDRGRGISQQEDKQVLNPFFTTKPSGMGMGLAICQSIVASHGGRLWFENNQDGAGATFRFTLPLVSLDEPPPAAKETAAP